KDTYVMLTIGDGLITQIPAVLISVCAGIVVTRVASGENTTLGKDLGTQLFKSPIVLLLTSLIGLCLGLVSGLVWQFLPVVILLLVLAGAARYRSSGGHAPLLPLRRESVGTSATLISIADSDESEAEDQRVVIAFDRHALYPTFERRRVEYLSWWKELQHDLYSVSGLSLPDVRVIVDSSLPAGHYSFSIGGLRAQEGRLPLDCVVVETNPDDALSLGIVVAQEYDRGLEVVHPINGTRVFWARRSPALQLIVDAAEIRCFDFMQFVSLQVVAFLRYHPEEVVSMTSTFTALRQLEQQHPGLLSDSVFKEFINVSRLTEVLQELAREGVSIRDFRSIVESVAAYCSTEGSSMVEDGDFDLQDIVSFVRVNRKRHTVSQYLSNRGTLKVFTLSNEIQDLLDEMPVVSGARQLAVDPDIFEQLRTGLHVILDPVITRGILPVSILCRSDLRQKVTGFLQLSSQRIGVITFDELDPMVSVEPVGIWSVS
ncbi:MAG: FHIPEP family type III secretion protein, partial [Bdellovibrionales bacterium]|nr:FHIPEP family type III secretion protein [Bdellovibrionales bacterium]